MALLPSLPPELLEQALRLGLQREAGVAPSPEQIKTLLGQAEYPGNERQPDTVAQLFASDRFRAALGRIACMYDGGHIVDDA